MTNKNTFFSQARETYTKIEHILGHTNKILKMKRIENKQFNHNGIKLGSNIRKVKEKSSNI